MGNGASFDLTGRVALVTGASSGLGARFGRVLAAAGARVVLGARRRLMDADALDALLLYLCSDASGPVTGAAFTLDDGQSLASG